MKKNSALLALCVGISPVNGEFPAQRPVARSPYVFFHLCLNKRLSKQSQGWWFETPSRSLWRHSNIKQISRYPESGLRHYAGGYRFPGILRHHAMNIHNAEGVRVVKQTGFERVWDFWNPLVSWLSRGSSSHIDDHNDAMIRNALGIMIQHYLSFVSGIHRWVPLNSPHKESTM